MAAALTEQRWRVSSTTVGRLLHRLGYRLQSPRKLGIPAEVEHGIRRKWNIDSGKWNTDSGKWNIDSGGSGTAVPGVVNARR